MNRIVANIGNSRTSCGYFRAGQLLETWHYPAADLLTAGDEIAARIKRENSIDLAVCSVVPSATKKFKRALLAYGIDGYVVTAQSQNIIHGAYPTIGTDRIASAVAAVRQFRDEQTLLVFDFGTATTLTAIERSGKFLGGFITLGLGKTFDALHRYTGQLPDLKQTLGAPLVEGLAHDTESAITTGSVLGHVGLFESWVDRARKILGTDCTVVATGGYARYLEPYTKQIDHLEPHLTLIGINLLAEEAKIPEGQV
jgi:type III pantothenate kinase